MTQTPRLGLPLLAPGQAQKDITHNEALLLIDIIGQSVAISADLSVPPVAPAAGQCWIVAAGASGEWSGRDHAIAGWTDNGWRFLMPAPGWHFWVTDRGHALRFDGAAWREGAVREDGFYVGGERILSARQSGIANPTGGATSDLEARAAIVAILNALRAHGVIAS